MHKKLFPSQQPNEKLLIIVREHWIRLFIKLFAVGVFAVAPAIFQIAVGSNNPFTQTEEASTLFALILQMYYIIILIALFLVWILYYLNIHIVSEKRIVDIDQVGLLHHEVSELNVDTIEDVTSETSGLLGNIFDYGTVYIQTAGTTERFEFDNVPHPAHIANVILTLYEQSRKSNPEN